MATTIITTIESGVLSSNIKDIEAKTDSDKVTATLCYFIKENASREIFTTTLYPDDYGYIQLSDVASLIEADLRSLGDTYGTYFVTIENAKLTFTVRYCEYSLPSDIDLDESFFSTAESQLVHESSPLTVSMPSNSNYVPHEGSAFVSYLDTEGKRHVNEIVFTTLGGELTLSAEDLISKTKETIDSLSMTPLAKVIAIHLSVGSRIKTFFLDDDPQWQLFRYRNIFNAVEYFEVKGTTTVKTDVSTDTAVVGGVTMLYNHQTTRTYRVETVGLTQDQANMIDQMFNSRELALIDTNGDELDVIITEHTCEISDADDALVTVKFTWRFADERPRLLSDVVNMHPSSGVFAEQFNVTFA